MTDKNPAVIVLSRRGQETADRLKAALAGAEVHALEGRASGDRFFTDAAGHLRTLFLAGRPLVGVCAAGILIRALAPALRDKRSEPPVVAVSEDGRSVVPLLGGHHGANALALALADTLQGYAAITASADVHFKIALDEPPKDYVLSNPEDAKVFMAELLAGAAVRLTGDAAWLSDSALPLADDGALRISVTTDAVSGDPRHLVYHPKTLVLGMGCERGASSQEAIELAEKALFDAEASPHALAGIASIDLKADEAALHAVASHFGVPAFFFPRERLAAEEDRLRTPSAAVKAEVGVAGVAEGAALAAAGSGGILRLPKRKSARVTAALGEAFSPAGVGYGARRGRVFLVGIGPGGSGWRSHEAESLLARASDWVGYGLYLDLVRDLRQAQNEHRFPLGAEEKRVRHALELAASGKEVAVVCSGDPGIYAMAALACELMDNGAAGGPLSDAARRVEIVVSPGISAFQAAAARAGAPVGHDFCCISLSDLLTPRSDIVKRIQAAAEGDFVAAFYNPRSKRRDALLDEAFSILRAHRAGTTPVILATDLGRPAENVRAVTLDTVKSADVDMLTLVIVGSSSTKTFKTGDGRSWVYTPRGYSGKELE